VYTESRGAATDNSRQLAVVTDRCNRFEQEARKLNELVTTLGKDKIVLEEEIRELRRAGETVSRRTVSDKEELRRNHQQLQDHQQRADELQVLTAHLESTLKIEQEKTRRMASSLDDRFAKLD
jgi:predicted  nucleic acid-binding Zn-ribbon protein